MLLKIKGYTISYCPTFFWIRIKDLGWAIIGLFYFRIKMKRLDGIVIDDELSIGPIRFNWNAESVES